MTTAYHITVVRPPGNIHADAFAEVALLLEAGFRRLGLPVTRAENFIPPGATSIILGPQLLAPALIPRLAPGLVLYNFEQLDPDSIWFQRSLTLFAGRTVWEYSRENLHRLKALGLATGVRHVPLGYVPELTCIRNRIDPDIDVLFYGSLNPRRLAVLETLRRRGLNVQQRFGVYGAERDALIARSKVVLNVHYYDAAILEFVRISYLLANHKAVVSETSAPRDLDPELEQAVRFARYEELADAVQELVNNPAERRRREEAGFEVMRRRDEATILQRALGLTSRTNDHTTP